MRGIFVTGTDTGVGKTLFCAALLLHLGAAGVRAAGCKPLAAGCRREGSRLISADAELIAAAAPIQRPLEIVNPLAFEPAIAPHIAAAECGRWLDVPGMAAACRAAAHGAEFIVIEGAGGWRVPIGATGTLADVAVALEYPVVLVVGLRLGCLNHALLTAEAIRRDGLPFAGWVANVLPPAMSRLEENVLALEEWLGPPLARLSALPAVSDAERARLAAATLAPGLAARLNA
jgi:dethiobiotin synthetase